MLLGAVADGDHAVRMQRAYAGLFTTRGATSPQEAVAFAGAFAQLYHKTKRPISQNAQLASASFLALAAIPDDAKVARLALQLGASSLMDRVKAGIAGPFSKLGGVVPGTSRALAVDVLQHAASVYAAAGESALAAAMVRAAGGDNSLAQDMMLALTETAKDLATGAAAVVGNPVAAAERVLDTAAGKVVEGVQDIGNKATTDLHAGIDAIVGPAARILEKGERLMDDAAALPGKMEAAGTKAMVGAINMGSAAFDSLISQGKTTLAALDARAKALADMGEGAVKDQLDYVRGLAGKLKGWIDQLKAAPGKFTAAMKEKVEGLRATIDEAWAKLSALVASAKASADASIARLGKEFSAGLAQVMETGRKASEAAKHLADTAYTALSSKVDLATAALSEGAKKAVALTSQVDAGLTSVKHILYALIAGAALLLLILLVK